MARMPQEFARLLTKAVNQIHALEDKPKQEVKDELGIAAGRQGHHTIEYWCKGHIPDDAAVELLAREIAKRKALARGDLRSFLLSAGYLQPDALLAEIASDLEQKEPPNGSHQVSDDPPRAAAPDEPAGSQPRRSLHARRKVLLAIAMLVPVLFATVILARQAVEPQKVETARGVSLVTGRGGSVRVASAQGRLTSGSIIKVGTAVTVTFKVVNNGIDAVTLPRLMIAAKGPGVSCGDSTKTRWAGPNAEFPVATAVKLAPGQEYQYLESRAFYLPGKYFLEPLLKAPNGSWNGISPFTCIDLTVVDSE